MYSPTHLSIYPATHPSTHPSIQPINIYKYLLDDYHDVATMLGAEGAVARETEIDSA
jgi:hypothetical protein